MLHWSVYNFLSHLNYLILILLSYIGDKIKR